MKKVMIILAAISFFGFANAQPNMLLNWANPYTSSTTTSSYGMCVANYSGNDVFSAGIFQASAPGIDFNPGSGIFNLTSTGTTTDMYITSLMAPNVFNWAIRIDGPGVEMPERMISNGSDIYIVGYFTQTANFNSTTSRTSAGGDDIFIARYDLAGNLIWVNRFGSAGTDRAMGVCFTPSGNLLVCGLFSGSVAFDPSYGHWSAINSAGGTDAFFAEYNLAGGLVGVARGIGGAGNDAANSITTDTPLSGRIIVCGSYGMPNCDFDPGPSIASISCAGVTDAFVASYTLAGAYNWAQTFGALYDDLLLDVVTDASNDIYVTGGFYKGTVNLGPFALTNSAASTGFADILLAKCSSAGVWQWAEKVGDVNDDVSNSIGLDNLGHVYISGYFANTADFDYFGSAAGSVVNSIGGSRDIFIARYDVTTGSYNDVDVIAGTGMDRGHGMCIENGLPAVYITGEYGNANTDFLTGPGVYNLTTLSTIPFNAFLASYNPSSVPVHHHGTSTNSTTRSMELSNNTTSFYPNPVSSTLFIENVSEGAVAEIYSLDGQKAGTWNANGNEKMSLDLSSFAEGIYLLRVTAADGSVTTDKIIVQH